ncbi:CLUMA_CG011413, isoform A [Clunio marinus]|uniref:CLUMA_CG011413, isoform A n=1 Tax=Clunio marinus TaxID=568069 RepID=A0A1J1IER1_9DIPT|nr:CLUMA_CG011413, isoform A [Clunio marinus]
MQMIMHKTRKTNLNICWLSQRHTSCYRCILACAKMPVLFLRELFERNTLLLRSVEDKNDVWVQKMNLKIKLLLLAAKFLFRHFSAVLSNCSISPRQGFNAARLGKELFPFLRRNLFGALHGSSYYFLNLKWRLLLISSFCLYANTSASFLAGLT